MATSRGAPRFSRSWKPPRRRIARGGARTFRASTHEKGRRPRSGFPRRGSGSTTPQRLAASTAITAGQEKHYHGRHGHKREDTDARSGRSGRSERSGRAGPPGRSGGLSAGESRRAPRATRRPHWQGATTENIGQYSRKAQRRQARGPRRVFPNPLGWEAGCIGSQNDAVVFRTGTQPAVRWAGSGLVAHRRAIATSSSRYFCQS